MNLITDHSVLYSRGQKIRRLLKAISRDPDGPAWESKGKMQEIVLAAHGGAVISQRYVDWRFPTTNPNFSAQYFERWEKHENNLYFLERSYLHLYWLDDFGTAEKEYILLHCDPNEPEDADHYIYKRNPHLHISVAEQPIPHSHFALCLSNIDDVLSSIDRLDDALGHILLMLRDQVLDHVN